MIDMTDKYEKEDEVLAKYTKAMAHPARIAILRFLVSRDSCFFGDIQNVLPITKSTVSKHLAELKDAGLIQGEIIPPKVKYCINKENWRYAKQIINELLCDYKTDDKCCE